MKKLIYKNANEAYEQTLKLIEKNGVKFDNTLALFNHGFIIENPMDNLIINKKRNWNLVYAEREWNWYLTKNANVKKLAEKAKIWLNHMDSYGNVNSNYGAQINRNNQLNIIIDEIKRKKTNRHAWLTIYDGKEKKSSPFTNNGYEKDTPCTLNIGFQYYDNKLHMTVLMRSNDIWFGFCNDQYCFSMIFKEVCEKSGLKMGNYYHFAANMHKYI
jgi:thymidylate synthase